MLSPGIRRPRRNARFSPFVAVSVAFPRRRVADRERRDTGPDGLSLWYRRHRHRLGVWTKSRQYSTLHGSFLTTSAAVSVFFLLVAGVTLALQLVGTRGFTTRQSNRRFATGSHWLPAGSLASPSSLRFSRGSRYHLRSSTPRWLSALSCSACPTAQSTTSRSHGPVASARTGVLSPACSRSTASLAGSPSPGSSIRGGVRPVHRGDVVPLGAGRPLRARALADADHLRSLPQRSEPSSSAAACRCSPAARVPGGYRRVATDLVSLFAPDAVAAIGWAFRTDVRTALALAYGALVVATLASGSLAPMPAGRGCSTPVRRWACLPTSPSSRRCSPSACTSSVALAAPRRPPAAGRRRRHCRTPEPRPIGGTGAVCPRRRPADRCLARSPRRAIFLVPNPPGSVPEWVALYLVFIAVVTLPHVVVVSIMDREQSVWA